MILSAVKPAAWLKRISAGLAAAVLAACVSLEQAAPPAETLAAGVKPAAAAQLRLGREIYVTRCARCHSVEPVRKYSRAHWERDILPDMAEETNLTASDAAAVRAYVLAVLDSPEAPTGR